MITNRLQGHNPLTNDQMFKVAPSIFATEPHESRSDRYTYIPTIDVLNGLRKEGFEPFFVSQSRTRIEGKQDFTKHMIRLRQQGDILQAGQKAVVGETVHEIVLVNSHDGTSSYQMMAGIYRYVCSNGMVVGEGVQSIKVAHKGNIVDGVITGAFDLMGQFALVQDNMEWWRGLNLSQDERHIFAKAALALKYDEGKAPIEPERLALPHRRNDQGSDLWTTFNVVQENLTQGGQRGMSASGQRVRTREVAGIDNNVKLNKSLWILGNEMARLKEGREVIPA